MKAKRKYRSRKDKKKGIYVLPSLLTSASLFGGFYAIIAAIQGRFEAASIAIMLSCVFDALDGKIARMTGTTSHFGAEYDSLSDLVAFGAAPGVLAFQWALEPFGRLGWLASFTFVICGALRLARFNVQNKAAKSSFFKGLPIPAAAGMIASLILFESTLGGLDTSRHLLFIILIYVLSFLMVSTLRYPSFKELELKRSKTFNVLVSTILILIVIAYKPKVMLFVILTIYTLSGPVIALYFLRKRRTKQMGQSEELQPMNPTGEASTPRG